MKRGLTTSVILGSTRVGRVAPKVGDVVVKKLKAKGHEVHLIDPAAEEFQLPSIWKPLHHYKSIEEAPEKLRKIANILEQSDGFILIASEYNHAPPPALLHL
jgi:NAD(P)H-dependent FMN reductase